VRTVLSVGFSCLVGKQGNQLHMVAGNPATPVGSVIPDKDGSPVSYTFRTERPVLSNDLKTERRFDAQRFLENGWVSAALVPVPKRGSRTPAGVLMVASATPRAFTVDDANYLQSIACLLSEAVDGTGARRGAARRNA
jgi:GAF domain-containing protein